MVGDNDSRILSPWPPVLAALGVEVACLDSLVVGLRLVHVVLGAVWVGAMLFTSFFLAPAVRDVGPEGGKVMEALQRRGVMYVMPAIGLLTIVSGVWLVERVWGGMANLFASRIGLAFVVGGAASVVAFLVGITVMRPAMKRAAALTAALQSGAGEEERAASRAEIQRLRGRGATAGLVATWLLLLAVAAMAVARHL